MTDRELIERIKAATEAPDAPRVAGEEQCRFCKAKAKCDAYTAKRDAIEIVATTAVASLDNAELEKVFREVTAK